MKRGLETLITMSLLVLVAGCDNSVNLPTFPTGGFEVEAQSTATQAEPSGFRIQLRMRVLSGLGELSQSSAGGSAQARTCLPGGCVAGPLTPDFGEATCPDNLDPGGARADIAFGNAWLNGNLAGVDFCVSEIEEGVVFETTLRDPSRSSNTIRTSCGRSGADLVCASN